MAHAGTHESRQGAAKARGVNMGRKPFPSAPQIAHARHLIEQGEPPDAVASSLKIWRPTIDRALR
jgi:DNA invertase Pin-like site-specific DNA recombinase